MRHSDADIFRVTLCPWCGLPQCEHGHCLDVGNCPKADATMCPCYVIYRPNNRRGQKLVGNSKCQENGRAGGKRRSSAA